jgi:ribosomal protein S6
MASLVETSGGVSATAGGRKLTYRIHKQVTAHWHDYQRKINILLAKNGWGK